MRDVAQGRCTPLDRPFADARSNLSAAFAAWQLDDSDRRNTGLKKQTVAHLHNALVFEYVHYQRFTLDIRIKIATAFLYKTSPREVVHVRQAPLRSNGLAGHIATT